MSTKTYRPAVGDKVTWWLHGRTYSGYVDKMPTKSLVECVGGYVFYAFGKVVVDRYRGRYTMPACRVWPVLTDKPQETYGRSVHDVDRVPHHSMPYVTKEERAAAAKKPKPESRQMKDYDRIVAFEMKKRGFSTVAEFDAWLGIK